MLKARYVPVEFAPHKVSHVHSFLLNLVLGAKFEIANTEFAV